MLENNNGSVNAGSPITSSPSANSLGTSTGGTSQKNDVQISPDQIKNLESLVGRQGQELGEYREFFQNIAPLLDKLDKNPQIVQAILDEKITPDLAKAAMEGKITISDATIVSKAQTEVKKEVGAKNLEKLSSEEVTKLVEDKAVSIRAEMEEKLKERDDALAFEKNVNEFIARTPDFQTYAEAIDKWLDSHDVTDVSIAYYAVKGELSEKEAKKIAEKDQAEHAKGLAANAGGGSSLNTYVPAGSNIIDSLIGGKSNPNRF